MLHLNVTTVYALRASKPLIHTPQYVHVKAALLESLVQTPHSYALCYSVHVQLYGACLIIERHLSPALVRANVAANRYKFKSDNSVSTAMPVHSASSSRVPLNAAQTGLPRRHVVCHL